MLAAPVAGSQAAATTLPQATGYEEYGPLSDAREGNDGVVWLKVWKTYVRYRVGSQPAEKRDALISPVKRAGEAGRSVRIRYDASHGRFDAAAGSLDYPLCSIALDDVRFEPADGCRDQAPPPADFATTLALAQAEMSRGNFEAAHRLLSPLALPA